MIARYLVLADGFVDGFGRSVLEARDGRYEMLHLVGDAIVNRQHISATRAERLIALPSTKVLKTVWVCTKCNVIVSEGGPQDIPLHRKYNHCYAPVEKREIA